MPGPKRHNELGQMVDASVDQYVKNTMTYDASLIHMTHIETQINATKVRFP